MTGYHASVDPTLQSLEVTCDPADCRAASIASTSGGRLAAPTTTPLTRVGQLIMFRFTFQYKMSAAPAGSLSCKLTDGGGMLQCCSKG